ncbi:alpha/beta hydrolase [Streptomyces gobiensis]|uniref:alpha/beta hydrolase n=1 Tax=Streptomyces gobiensis TaxID=2875706 RepID=UPI001E5807F0|nr:alpha/beta hydrolase [Streptomyces gobiensis]UGY93067.1 alpha/beta hydrolase [Streptomyces gobiensis]
MAMQFLTAAWRLLAVLAVLWLLLVLAAWYFQRQLIYLPDRSDPPLPPGSGVTEVRYTTADGHELTGWFLPAAGEAARPYATVVVSNGNAGNRGDRLPLAKGLAARGYSVLLSDYRGYGGNPGRPTERGLLADLRAAASYAAGRDGVDPERLVYFGESLGSAVVAALAAERPPAALVLRSPFPELADVGQAHYWFLPVRPLLHDRFRTEEHLARYDGPTLVIAGERDEIIPTRLSRRLAEKHADTYREIAGAHHNDSALFSGTEFLDAIDAFLRDSLPD